MKIWSRFFLFLLGVICFSGCAQPPVENKAIVGEKCIIVPENVKGGAPKSKVYNKSHEEVRQAVKRVLLDQGFCDVREGSLRDEMVTEKLRVENPHPADVSEDVLKTLVSERISFSQAKNLTVVSHEATFSKIISSAYRMNQSYAMTAGLIRGDFFRKLDVELGKKAE